MAYDLEAGVGPDLPVGDRYYGPREWAARAAAARATSNAGTFAVGWPIRAHGP
jgi:hypothetical protein